MFCPMRVTIELTSQILVRIQELVISRPSPGTCGSGQVVLAVMICSVLHGHYCPEAELCLHIKASRTQLSALPSSVCPMQSRCLSVLKLPVPHSIALTSGLMGGSVKHANTLSTGLARSKSTDLGVKSVTWLGTVGEN